MRTVVWSARAASQYLSALAYLADKNPPAADKLFECVEATAESLAKRPIGRPGYADGTFEKIIRDTSYILVFELPGDNLRILRLFHMSQDWRGWRDAETDAQ